jgi:hypothetical protein
VGVEPTILAAKDRINGFEGHEGHRTPFASDELDAALPFDFAQGKKTAALHSNLNSDGG